MEKINEKSKRLEGIHEGSIYDYDILKTLYPNYDEDRSFLRSILTIRWPKIVTYVKKHYRESNIYEVIDSQNFKDGQVLREDVMLNQVINFAKTKHAVLLELFESCRSQGIQLCDLVEYIINYPVDYPAPWDYPPVPHLEALMEKYDIIIRYYMHDDIDKMQIQGDALLRLVGTLDTRMEDVKSLITQINNLANYTHFSGDTEAMVKQTLDYEEKYLAFPLSSLQKVGQSAVEKGRYFQQLRHSELDEK